MQHKNESDFHWYQLVLFNLKIELWNCYHKSVSTSQQLRYLTLHLSLPVAVEALANKYSI